MKRIVSWQIMCVVVLACGLAVAGCKSREIRDLEKVASIYVSYLHEQQSDAGSSSSMVMRFDTGELDGGTAVVCQGGEAFWVNDGKVYTVNDSARQIAPELPVAPGTITFERVRAVAD